jgi:hypothetical protein
MPVRPTVAAALAVSSLSSLTAQSPPHGIFDGVELLTAMPSNAEIELVADLDNDGDVDAVAFGTVAGSAQRATLRPLHNDGHGNLTLGTLLGMPAQAGAPVAIADVDGDGFADVLATALPGHVAGPGVLVFRGVGGTTFAPPVHVPLAGEVRMLGTGNANGDGVADVFVLHGAGALQARWLLGGAALTFPSGPAWTFPALTVETGTVLDLDGDGVTDFAVLTPAAAGSHAWLFRTVPGGFDLHGVFADATAWNAQVAAADVDGDGDVDLQTMSFEPLTGVQLRTLRNDGAQGFAAAAIQHIVGGPIAVGLRVADWDHDGDGDLLVRTGVSSGSNPQYGLALLANDGGVFAEQRRETIPTGPVGLGAPVADLDGDGHPDCVEPRAVLFGAGSTRCPQSESHTLVDWDGDGDLDAGGWLGMFANDGRGVMTEIAGYWPQAPAPTRYSDLVATGDFDGDGLMEHIVVNDQVLSAWPLNIVFHGMRRLEADGDGRLVDVGLATTQPMWSGFVDDADDDGDLDVLTAQGLWHNDGTGVFTLLPTTHGVVLSDQADIDGDGDLDYVGTVGTQVTLALLQRTGPSAYVTVPLPWPGTGHLNGTAPRFADVDDDGNLDVVTRWNNTANAIYTLVLQNHGGGNWSVGTTLAGGGWAVVAGDFDGDGRTDLCAQEQRRLLFFRRVGPGLQYAPPQAFAWTNARGAADLDQDGDPDIVGPYTLWNRSIDMPVSGQRRQYGNGAAGSGGRRPVLSIVGPLRAGSAPVVRLASAPGGAPGILFASGYEANVPNLVPGVTAWIGPATPLLTAVCSGTTGQPGAGTFELPIFVPPGLQGLRLYLQFVVLDPATPAGLGHSNGNELVLGG